MRQGANPVYILRPWAFISRYKDTIVESGCLRLQPQLGGKHSSKAKYWQETDSKQVPWGKDEKNFEKRVKLALETVIRKSNIQIVVQRFGVCGFKLRPNFLTWKCLLIKAVLLFCGDENNPLLQSFLLPYSSYIKDANWRVMLSCVGMRPMLLVVSPRS